jgi:hypothetical protein
VNYLSGEAKRFKHAFNCLIAQSLILFSFSKTVFVGNRAEELDKNLYKITPFQQKIQSTDYQLFLYKIKQQMFRDQFHGSAISCP